MFGITPKLPCLKCGKPTRERENGKPIHERCLLWVKVESEKKLKCPSCGAEMWKKLRGEIGIDLCPKCGGIWLDKNELKKIIGNESTHTSSGFATGMALGMAIN